MTRTTPKKKRRNPSSSTPTPKNPASSKSKPRPHKRHRKPQPLKPQNPNPNPDTDSDSDSPPPSSPTSIRRLLEPCTKGQLISLLADAAADDAALVASLRAVADGSASHRKLFVYGLGHDATRDALLAAFSPFGAVDCCNVIDDRSTGRCKGYGFVLFASRFAARRALRVPGVLVGSRPAFVQLASFGPPAAAGGSASGGGADRRVYVSNVAPDAHPDKLRAFFSQFGDLEGGPFGFDAATGKSRGYALFVYKNADGAKKALAEPHRTFEGRMLHCQVANDPAQKNKAPVPTAATPTSSAVVTPPPGTAASPFGAAAMQQPVLAALTAAQNLALYGQNPAYAALLGQNPLLAAAAFNPAVAAAAFNPAVVAAAFNPAVAAAAFNPAAMAALSPAAAVAAPKVGVSRGAAPRLLGTYQSPSAASGRTGTMPGSSFGGFPGYRW